MKKYVTGILGIFLLVVIDQFTKSQAVLRLKDSAGITIIPGVLRLEYLENRGAAFGILQGQRIPLLIVTVLIAASLAFLYHKLPVQNKYLPMHCVLILLGSGAIGNMIDRICNTFVVDFIYFCLIDFPVFNVADCYVVIGVILAILLLLFYYQEEDLGFLERNKRSAE